MPKNLLEDASIREIARQVVQANRILANQGIITTNYGHLSARIPDTNYICIIGHLHEHARLITEASTEEVAIVDLDGKYVAGYEPPSERFIHTGIYRARPDVGSVIHSHALWSTAFGIAGVPIRPVYLLGTIFSPEVPVLDYAGLIHSTEEGDRLGTALGRNWAILLRGHGSAVAGRNIPEACAHAFALERTAQLQHLANLIGRAQSIPESELVGSLVRGLETDYAADEWTYWQSKDPVLPGATSNTPMYW